MRDLILLLFFLCSAFDGWSQQEIDTLKICHSKDGFIESITNGRNKLFFTHGEPSLWIVEKEHWSYDFSHITFSWNTEKVDSQVSLQVLDTQIIFDWGVKSTDLCDRSDFLLPVQGYGSNYEKMMVVNGMYYDFVIKNSKVSRMSFLLGDLTVVFTFDYLYNQIHFNFQVLDSDQVTNATMLQSMTGRSYIMSVGDRNVGLDILFFFSPNTNFPSGLSILKWVEEYKTFGITDFKRLKYSKKGIIRQRRRLDKDYCLKLASNDL